MSDDTTGPKTENETDAEAKAAKTAEPTEPTHKADGRAAGPSDWAPRPLMGPRRAWALAVLSGLLGPIGFSNIDIWPVAFVAWVPLIVAIRGQSPKRAAALATCAGFVMTMVGYRWLIGMLEVFSGFPLPLCVALSAILCLQKGGRLGLAAWISARATRRGWPHAITFIGGWAVSELIYPLLFTWYMGASVHNVPLLMQTADLGGPILVTTLVMVGNVALAELLEKPLFGRSMHKGTLAGCAAFMVLSIVYGAVRLSSEKETVAKATKITVGMVQGNMPLKGRHGALKVHLKLTRELRKKGADLVVWSEASMSRSFSVKKYAEQIKSRVTRHLGVPAIVGGVVYERLERKGNKGRRVRLFNSAFITDEKGNVRGRYDKQFLLMFGEYLPFGDQFPVLYEWSPNSGSFSKGKSFKPLPFGKHAISTMICYEDLSPTFVNELVRIGKPDLLVNMTNDAWFGDTDEPWQHLALAKFRSVEQRKYMVRVTNSGVSAIIDSSGRATVQTDTFVETAVTGEVALLNQPTVYSVIGNAPWWALTAIMGLLCFWKKPKNKRPKNSRARAA